MKIGAILRRVQEMSKAVTGDFLQFPALASKVLDVYTDQEIIEESDLPEVYLERIRRDQLRSTIEIKNMVRIHHRIVSCQRALPDTEFGMEPYIAYACGCEDARQKAAE